MKTNTKFLTLLLSSSVILASGAANAALVKLTGVSATASNSERVVSNLVDGTGFNSTTQTVTQTNASGAWNTNTVTKAATWVKFDLGSVQQVGDMWVFNYNDTFSNAENRRFVTADIWYSDTGATVNPTVATPGDWTRLTDDQAFLAATYTTSYNTPTMITIGQATRYILMNDIVNNGATVWGNSYGLEEVEFFQPVPEPSASALLGLAGLALILRRRK